MLAKSKITLINQKIPTKIIKKFIPIPGDMFGKQKMIYEEIPNTIVKSGETVGLISKCNGINGVFFIVINIKNEIFYLQEDQIELSEVPKFKFKYKNSTPKFNDFLDIPQFDIFSF